MKLIGSFIYSVITANDRDTLYKLKDSAIPAKERPYLDFVKDYYGRFTKMPDLATVESKFNVQLNDNMESAKFWLGELNQKYKESIIEKAVVDAARNKGDALDIFQQAIIEHSQDADGKVVIYSDGKKRINEYLNRKMNKGITHLSTGSEELDSFSLGFKKADLWTIGGREFSGKTWYLCRMANWLDLWLLDQGIERTILIVSGEMESEEFEERLDSIRCELAYARLSRGTLNRGEEMKYKRFLKGFKSNIRIIDNFDGLADIEQLILIMRPCIVFIDGSHLLSRSYEWTEIAKVTASMKRITRNNKVPIVNTTHLKADKGKSASGGDLDDFAYTKGYTRDSDIVGVMFASDMMELENKIGIDWVKVRRGNKTRNIWQNDYETSSIKLIESQTGEELASARVNGGSPDMPNDSQLNYDL